MYQVSGVQLVLPLLVSRWRAPGPNGVQANGERRRRMSGGLSILCFFVIPQVGAVGSV
jgi:hypothetical protein